jgi:hypothetical protein
MMHPVMQKPYAGQCREKEMPTLDRVILSPSCSSYGMSDSISLHVLGTMASLAPGCAQKTPRYAQNTFYRLVNLLIYYFKINPEI